jgi:hypothetical protein
MQTVKLSRPIAFACAVLALSSAAYADCYDVFGCSERDRFSFDQLANGPNCEFLYRMRNRIYAQHQYCFRTARAIATLGNQGCRFNDVNEVPLNAAERANAVAILQAEQAKGCQE